MSDLRTLDVALGSVSAERRFADGRVDSFADFSLELYIEPGPWGEIRQHQMGRGTTLRSSSFEDLFVRAVSSLCEPTVPPAVKLPRPTPRQCTVEALVREGWAESGAEVACRGLDDHWNPGMPIEFPAFLSRSRRAGRTDAREGLDPSLILRP